MADWNGVSAPLSPVNKILNNVVADYNEDLVASKHKEIFIPWQNKVIVRHTAFSSMK